MQPSPKDASEANSGMGHAEENNSKGSEGVVRSSEGAQTEEESEEARSADRFGRGSESGAPTHEEQHPQRMLSQFRSWRPLPPLDSLLLGEDEALAVNSPPGLCRDWIRGRQRPRGSSRGPQRGGS